MVLLWHVENLKAPTLPKLFSLLGMVACTIRSFLKFTTNVNMIVPSQMTVQELSSMIRSEIKPIIFVINNGGYTIERLQQNKDGLVWTFFDSHPLLTLMYLLKQKVPQYCDLELRGFVKGP